MRITRLPKHRRWDIGMAGKKGIIVSYDQPAVDEAVVPAPRKPWTSPEMTSLNASASEFNPTTPVDGEGNVS
jgi:hypothetical protein